MRTTTLETDFTTNESALDSPSIGAIDLSQGTEDISPEDASGSYKNKWSIGMKLSAFFKDVSVSSRGNTIKPKGSSSVYIPIASYMKKGGSKRLLADAVEDTYEQRLIASRSQPIVRAEFVPAQVSLGLPAPLDLDSLVAPLTDAEMVEVHADAEMKRPNFNDQVKPNFPVGWMKYTVYTDSNAPMKTTLSWAKLTW